MQCIRKCIRHWHHHAVFDQRLPAYLLAASRCKLLGIIHIYGIAGIFHQSRSSGIREKLTREVCDSYPRAYTCNSTDSCVRETRHCYKSHPAKTVTILQEPTLFLGLACRCLCLVSRIHWRPTSAILVRMLLTSAPITIILHAQFDKGLRCEHLRYKL